MIASILFLAVLFGVYDSNLIVWIVVNSFLLLAILLLIYMLISDLIRKDNLLLQLFRFDDRSTILKFTLINALMFFVLIIVYEFYNSGNIFEQITPYYLVILGCYLLVFLGINISYYVDLYQKGEISRRKIKFTYLEISQFSLMGGCLLNQFYYSNPNLVNSEYGFGVIFILMIIAFLSIFSWLYFLQNKNSVFHYLYVGNQFELKQNREEFINSLITKNSILYSHIVNFLAAILFLNILMTILIKLI